MQFLMMIHISKVLKENLQNKMKIKVLVKKKCGIILKPVVWFIFALFASQKNIKVKVGKDFNRFGIPPRITTQKTPNE